MSESKQLPRNENKQKVVKCVVTVKEAAEMLGVSVYTIRKLIKNKRLQRVQGIGPWRIELAHLRKNAVWKIRKNDAATLWTKGEYSPIRFFQARGGRMGGVQSDAMGWACK